MNTEPPGGGQTDPEEFLADERIGEEVRARRRERWIRQRLAQEATLSGALIAAVGREVALQLVTGDRIAGTLTMVGEDVVEVKRRHGKVWSTIDAVAALEVGASLPAAGPPGSGTTLAEVLTDLAEQRSEVGMTLVGGTAVRGELVEVGEVATVRTGPGGRTAYVSLEAVAWVSELP